MRNFAALYSVIALVPLVCARADLTIVQKIEGPGQNGEITVKIKGDKERMDAPSQPTRIIDGKTGEMTDLLNEKKSFIRISPNGFSKLSSMSAIARSRRPSCPSKKTRSARPSSTFQKIFRN